MLFSRIATKESHCRYDVVDAFVSSRLCHLSFIDIKKQN